MNQSMPMQNTQLNDQQRMEDLLTQEKYMISSYSSFLPEASCPQLRQVLTENLNQSAQSQFTVYSQMDQMGWYPAKPAQQADVTAAQQKFAQMKSQIGG